MCSLPNLAPTSFTSLIIDQKQAIRELSNYLSAHIIKHHRHHAETMQFNIGKITQMLIWFLLVSQGALVPESEEFLIAEVKRVRVELCKLLGVNIIGNAEDVEVVDVA